MRICILNADPCRSGSTSLDEAVSKLNFYNENLPVFLLQILQLERQLVLGFLKGAKLLQQQQGCCMSVGGTWGRQTLICCSRTGFKLKSYPTSVNLPYWSLLTVIFSGIRMQRDPESAKHCVQLEP